MDLKILISPPLLLIYGILFVVCFQLYLLSKNDRFCNNNVHLIIVPTVGKGVDKFIPKQGNSISLTNKDGTTDMWVLNKLNAFPMSYPPGGFSWLKRDIQTVILSEENWEPLSNSKPGTMVGSPRLLGTLFNEKVAAAIVGMGKEFTDAVKSMKKGMNTTYLLFGFVAIAAGEVLLWNFVKEIPNLITKLDAINKLIGG